MASINGQAAAGFPALHPMKILMISYWDFQEHGMQVTLRTPRYFAQRGHQVSFLVHSETTSNADTLVDVHPNITVVRFQLPLRWLGRIPGLRRPRQFVLFLIATLNYVFRRCQGAQRPDVIYAAEADAVLIGSLLRWWFGVPLVTRFYGVARIAAHFDPHTRRLRSMGLRHILSRMALTRRAEMIIVTDDGTNGKTIVEALNPRASNVKFWRNGIDPCEVTPEEIDRVRRSYGLRACESLLLTVSRLDAMKRVDRAIRALAAIDSKIPVRLLVVGDGPDRQSLERLARELGVAGRAIFAGKVHHSRIYPLYAACDIFLSLYDYSNVGNPLWEAINAGCCIVTLNTGLTGGVIADGVNGRLIDPGSDEPTTVTRVADAIRELAGDPALRACLAAGAKESRRQLWSWTQRLQAESEAIEELVRDFRRNSDGPPQQGHSG